MSKRPRVFKTDTFSAGYIDRSSLVSDEQRSFSAHHQVAAKGQPNRFTLTLKATLSAPFVVAQKSVSGVKTMGIDLEVDLVMLPPEDVSPVIHIREMDDDGETRYTLFSRLGDGTALRSFPDYGNDFPSPHEYARAALLDWAHRQFMAGVSHMQDTQMFDRAAFDRLKSEIQSGLVAGGENLIYVARTGRGQFMQKSAPPRLVFKELDRSHTVISLKLAPFGTDPAADWVGILTSMPAEMAATASKLRYAIMNATADRLSDLDAIDGTYNDDRIAKNGFPSSKDLWTPNAFKEREAKPFINAVRAMCRDILAFDEADTWFSNATTDAAKWFASLPVGDASVLSAQWENRMAELKAGLDKDTDALARFKNLAGWELSHSPSDVISAKYNAFVGNELSLGLGEASTPVQASTNGRRP